MAGRLEGRTALVVGAGQTPGATIGNGRATALLFAREGAHVVLADRDEPSVRETADQIAAAGGRADVVVSDIAAPGAAEALVAEAVSVLGRIDILHNNVGIGAGDATPTSLTEEAFDRIMHVNLRSLWLTCKAVVPVMRDQGNGSIISISSVAAVAGAGNLTAYKVSKAGINALNQNLALTNARYGIRANVIMPGLIDTPMAVDAVAEATGADRAEVADARARMVPMRRQGTAWDVAHAALFLASDESAFITGVTLPVDVGQCARVG